MSAAFVAMATGPERSAWPTSSMVFVGSFYNERFTEEHEYRDQIDLWREGERVFGLASNVAGLVGDQVPLMRRFEGSWSTTTGALTLSNRFRGTLTDSLLTGAYEYDADVPVRLERSTDRMATNPSRAPLTNYEAWRAWADRVIDEAEAKHPYLRQELTKCQGGDGQACLGVGNRLKDRRPEEAKRYWRQACGRDVWAACKFLGDQSRYQSILGRRCSSKEKPSLDRNMACGELGQAAEKAGKIGDAIKWYQLGCNQFELPATNCTRLKALRR